MTKRAGLRASLESTVQPSIRSLATSHEATPSKSVLNRRRDSLLQLGDTVTSRSKDTASMNVSPTFPLQEEDVTDLGEPVGGIEDTAQSLAVPFEMLDNGSLEEFPTSHSFPALQEQLSPIRASKHTSTNGNNVRPDRKKAIPIQNEDENTKRYSNVKKDEQIGKRRSSDAVPGMD